MNTTTNIVLIGFKSCGKTTIGQLLAKRLQRQFIDLDSEIEQLAAQQFGEQLTFAQIYATYGDVVFRDLEHRALQALSAITATVLATGGGAACTAANQPLLEAMGIVCYIRTAPAILMPRYERGRMPPYLRDNPTLENLQAIWLQRDIAYRQIADIIIDTDDAPPQYHAENLHAQLQPLLATSD